MATANTNAGIWDVKVGGGGGGGEYKLCPAGNHMGTIVHLFDVGTQAVPQLNGEIRKLRRLVIVFELKRRAPDGVPYFLGERLTFSMHEKAKLHQMVVNVLGAKFQQGDSFSVAKLLGRPVMVSVTHTSKGSGPDAKTYHNVGTVSAFPEEMLESAPQPTVTPSLWSALGDEPFPAGLDYLPWVYGSSIQSMAEESDEWKARHTPAAAVAAPALAAPAAGEDDDVPF